MSQSQNKLGVGVIGLGVGAQHLQTYLKHSRVKVVKICDTDPAVLSCFETYKDITRTLKEEEVLDDPEISLVSICSKDNDHYRQIVRAFLRGKHVFVEKPMCITFEEAQHIKELLQENPKLKLSSNLILRRYPRFVKLKELLDSGRLGTPFYIEADYNYGRLEKILNGWRGQIPGYSPILGGGIHLIDLIYWLTGLKPVAVKSVGGKLATRESTYKYFDLMSGLFEYENGMVVKTTVNLACVYPHFHRFSVYGTKATFENDFDYARFFYKSDPHRDFEKIVTEYPGVLKGDMIFEMVDHVLENKPISVTREDIFTVLSICFAFDSVAKDDSSTNIKYL